MKTRTATATTPSQKQVPKASSGVRAEPVEGGLVVYPGPKAAAVTDVGAGSGAVVGWARAETPPKVRSWRPGTV